MKRIAISILLISFFLVGALGMAFPGMMMGHGDVGMVGCPLMGHDAAVCNMNPLDHLSMWQTMFAAIPAQTVITALLLLLAAFFLLRFREFLWLPVQSPQLVFISYDPEVATHDPLRRFIARGLMHPKIF